MCVCVLEGFNCSFPVVRPPRTFGGGVPRKVEGGGKESEKKGRQAARRRSREE